MSLPTSEVQGPAQGHAHLREVTELGSGTPVSQLWLQSSVYQAGQPSEWFPGLTPCFSLAFLPLRPPIPGPPQSVAYFFQL